MTRVPGVDGDFWRGVIAAIILVFLLYGAVVAFFMLT